MFLFATLCCTHWLREYLQGECTYSQMLGAQPPNSGSGVHTLGPGTQTLLRDERAAAVAEAGGRVDG